MKKALLLVFLIGFALQAHAQQPASVMGPALKAQLRQQGPDAPLLADEGRVGVVIYTDDAGALAAAGVDVQARFDGFVTARVRPGDLGRIAVLSGVRKLDDPLLYPDNDVAAAVTGVMALRAGLFGGMSYTGTGVLVCVIDSGIDWDHGDFRSPTDPSQSRIRSIWDQTLTAEGGEATPFGFSYGVEYTRAQIEAALAGGPGPRTADYNGHGTHVAGTAAGNGASLTPAQHAGMAPGADLVVIKAGNGSFATSNIINGIAYCNQVATKEGKPAVLNVSLGSQFSAHDGTDAKSVAATAFGAEPGRVAVFSAGNDGDRNLHISGATSDGAATSFVFTVPSYTAAAGVYNDGLSFDLWYGAPGAVTVRLISPGGDTYVQVPGSDDVYASPEGEIYLFNYLDPANGDRHVYVSIDDGDETMPPASGTWTLEITNEAVEGMGFHGWIISNSFGEGQAATEATLAGSDPYYTLSNTPQGAFTVASFAHRWRWCASSGSCYLYNGASDDTDAISSFSSYGPTRDGRALPHIAAPGQGMISSLSSDAGVPPGYPMLMPGEQHWLLQGTSMATPVVTGAIALLMQQDPTLDFARTLALVQSEADADAYTGAVPNSRWGAGKLDAFGAMTRLVGTPGGAYQVRSYNGPLAGSSSLADGQALSLRFEHSLGFEGRMLGVLFHTSSSNLPTTGTLDFSIFTDDGAGKPGTQIGSTLPMQASQLQRFTWNYFDLTPLALDLHTDTEYHLVMRANGANNPIFVRHDGTPNDNRSLKENGGVWTVQPFDWGVRPIVLTADMALPVELVLFEGMRAGDGVVLSWMTASETNNAGFHVEARQGEGAWKELGFVEGSGTRTEVSRYRFTTTALEADTYTFRLKQVDFDGSTSYSGEVEVALEAAHALTLTRAGAHPAPEARVRFSVPRQGEARVEAFDALGRRVAILFSGEAESGRLYQASLEGMAAGVYLVRIVQENRQQSLTVVIAR